MTVRIITPKAVVLVLGTALGGAAFGTPVIQNQFKGVCKPKPATALGRAQCKSCHVTPPKLNSFGTDVKSEMGKQKTKTFTPAIWAKLAGRDSDGDGANDKREIAAGTLPGDARSKP
jgi:hypothetical protein